LRVAFTAWELRLPAQRGLYRKVFGEVKWTAGSKVKKVLIDDMDYSNNEMPSEY
jgi:hypothetical protein